jgi:hypothetical protein
LHLRCSRPLTAHSFERPTHERARLGSVSGFDSTRALRQLEWRDEEDAVGWAEPRLLHPARGNQELMAEKAIFGHERLLERANRT